MTLTQRRPAEPEAIADAARLIRAGRLVAFPTETVYGLGGDATSNEAAARIFAAKGRPRFNPLIAHVPDVSAALALGRFETTARRLAEAFWPGPLTLVVPARSGAVCDLVRAGLDSVALRVPDHSIATALLRAAGVPVAAPSANQSGRISPTTADHVMDDLTGRIDAVLDGGPTSVGLESTIVACLDEVHLLRPGGVSRDALERVLGHPMADVRQSDLVRAPGMLASHYAPHASVRLDAEDASDTEAVLDFGGHLAGHGGAVRLDLSPSGDLTEAAANLFGHLHRLDRSGPAAIAVAPIPMMGLGEAINDRLRRAAAPRH